MKKITSLIIALLISIVVWLLTFDLFFSYSRLNISLVVAIAAGIIAFLILRLLTKPQDTAPPLVWQFVIPILIAGGTLFVTSLITAPSCDNQAYPLIRCTRARVMPDEICVYKNGKIEFRTTAVPPGVTVKIYDFKKKDLYSETPDQPLDKPDYTGTNPHPIQARVKGDKEGYFKYSISCGDSDWSDPIIKVPH